MYKSIEQTDSDGLGAWERPSVIIPSMNLLIHLTETRTVVPGYEDTCH